ncbi:hypothetical protein KBW81_12760 [Loktanella salsilacus]|uniref:hypothetical protein n=1 Tax=Loktanella salsilacus TaxID=195913 RepID=UPI0020B79181|nr:hypothetical protein [Loktanella salsilacus]UTH47577.1 hypothetical protein KBW81_12760 [Loktanella salsilacus]
MKNTWRQISLLFYIIQGLFRPGLKKILKSIVSAQLEGNSEFRAHRYPLLVRAIRWSIYHPVLALIAISFPYLIVLLSPNFGWVSDLDLTVDKSASVRDFWAVNLGVFTVQAALVGVVFPLVIAFVGLLNQGRASFASRLTIYIDSSAALFVGVSSLLLCVSIAIQLPFGQKFVNVSFAVTLLNVAWFAMNAFALSYFVLRTIAFLHPSKRAPMIRTYVANVIWPRELLAAVTSNQWTNVAKFGHLPTGDEVDPFATGASARVWYSGIWKEGNTRVSRRLRRRMRLVDVRFGILKPVIDAWLVQARELDFEKGHDLVFPLQPGWSYEGEQVLARATIPLGLVARSAIGASFRFRSAPAENGEISETTKILSEMIADLIELIDARRANEFAEQLGDVVEFHAFIYRLAQSDDVNFSYAQLGSGGRMFRHPLNEQWAETYRDIIRRVVQSLPDEAELMRPIAYTSYKLYSRVSGEVTPEALRPLIWLGESLPHRLIDWAVGEYRAESTSGFGERRAFSLSRQDEVYSRAWREQVAGWEALLTVVATVPNRSDGGAESWKSLKLMSGNVWAHLHSTSQMTARAAWLGDTLATSWTTDLMLRWKMQAQDVSIRRGGQRGLQSEALTFEVLQSEWDEIEKLQLTPNGNLPSAIVVFNEILHNTWQDHILVLASLCIHWAMNSLASETATQAARMLLQDQHYDRGARVLREESGVTGADILVSALRIVGSGSQFIEGSYAGHIDHLLEGLSNFGSSPRVSMRIYTSGGGLSFSALSEAQAIGLMATSPGRQAVNGPLRRLLSRGNEASLKRKEAFLNSLVSSIDELSADHHSDLLARLVDLTDDVSFDARCNYARQLVNQCLSILTGHRDGAIVNAQIDETRIGAVSSAAASRAFSKSEFPLNLFDEITVTTDNLKEFTMSMSGLNKGEFTDPPMEQPVLNEEEWWRETMSDHVAAVVWSDVLHAVKLINVESQTPQEFWHAVRDGGARIRAGGDDPLLVIGNSGSPNWLFEWSLSDSHISTPKPADLVITNNGDQIDSYIFTMNNIPVYMAQIENGVAYLIPSQLLRRLRFHDYGGGLPVSLHFESDAENPWLGTMRVTFEREVELATDVESYRITWDDGPVSPETSDA